MWYSGSAACHSPSAFSLSTVLDAAADPMRCCQASGTALGLPVVPDVNMIEARGSAVEQARLPARRNGWRSPPRPGCAIPSTPPRRRAARRTPDRVRAVARVLGRKRALAGREADAAGPRARGAQTRAGAAGIAIAPGIAGVARGARGARVTGAPSNFGLARQKSDSLVHQTPDGGLVNARRHAHAGLSLELHEARPASRPR